MKKKGEEQKGVSEKAVRKSHEELNKMLIENFVSLQKVLTEMSSKFDRLSNNISGLLNLFEMSARSFMNRPDIKETEKDKEFLDKLNMLLDQNKTIAKGLTLMEEKIRERVYGRTESPPQFQNNSQMPQLPSITSSPQQGQISNIKKLPRF